MSRTEAGRLVASILTIAGGVTLFIVGSNGAIAIVDPLDGAGAAARIFAGLASAWIAVIAVVIRSLVNLYAAGRRRMWRSAAAAVVGAAVSALVWYGTINGLRVPPALPTLFVIGYLFLYAAPLAQDVVVGKDVVSDPNAPAAVVRGQTDIQDSSLATPDHQTR